MDLVPSSLNLITLSYGFFTGAFVVLAPSFIGWVFKFFRNLIHKVSS